MIFWEICGLCWRARFLKNREQGKECNNFGETEEVFVAVAKKLVKKHDLLSIPDGMQHISTYRGEYNGENGLTG